MTFSVLSFMVYIKSINQPMNVHRIWTTARLKMNFLKRNLICQLPLAWHTDKIDNYISLPDYIGNYLTILVIVILEMKLSTDTFKVRCYLITRVSYGSKIGTSCAEKVA